MTENQIQHFTNLGAIVYALSCHDVGDYGDCSVNDPIVNLIDAERPAHELLAALRRMPPDTASGIVGQWFGALEDAAVTI
jgi:hypothetical protein